MILQVVEPLCQAPQASQMPLWSSERKGGLGTLSGLPVPLSRSLCAHTAQTRAGGLVPSVLVAEWRRARCDVLTGP